MRTRIVFVVLLVIVHTYSGVRALHCYDCNSKNDSRCADDVPPDSMKRDCSGLVDGKKYTLCRKIVQIVEFSVNGMPADKRIIRYCGWDESHYNGRCYERSGMGGNQVVCSCSGNNCNTATGVKSFPFLLAGLPISLLLAVRYSCSVL